MLAAIAAFQILPLTSGICKEQAPACEKLAKKITGDGMKYSMHADVDGLVSYADFLCGIKLRANELCAMEMISFDASAKIYDYYSNQETEMTKAFFVVGVKSAPSGIAAFKDRETAQKFVDEQVGEILDYYELVEKYTH